MYIKYNVSLSDNQKSKLAKALVDKSAVVLRLSLSDLSGSDELYLTKTQIGKIQKAKASKKGLDLKISKTQINHVVKRGSGLFSSLMKLGTKLLPMATKLLPGVTTGLTSGLIDYGVSKALGSGVNHSGANQSGGFLIPQDKIDKLVEHKNLLTKKQKEQLLSALQSGGNYVIKPTKIQRGGLLASVLSMIGIPLILKALSGKGMSNRTSIVMKPQKIPITPKGKGSGMQNRPYSDMFLPYQTIPYINPDLNLIGNGVKSKKKRPQQGKGLLFGKDSPFQKIPILGTIF